LINFGNSPEPSTTPVRAGEDGHPGAKISAGERRAIDQAEMQNSVVHDGAEFRCWAHRQALLQDRERSLPVPGRHILRDYARCRSSSRSIMDEKPTTSAARTAARRRVVIRGGLLSVTPPDSVLAPQADTVPFGSMFQLPESCRSRPTARRNRRSDMPGANPLSEPKRLWPSLSLVGVGRSCVWHEEFRDGRRWGEPYAGLR
jgi:hypothetical protein